MTISEAFKDKARQQDELATYYRLAYDDERLSKNASRLAAYYRKVAEKFNGFVR